MQMRTWVIEALALKAHRRAMQLRTEGFLCSLTWAMMQTQATRRRLHQTLAAAGRACRSATAAPLPAVER